MASAGVPGRKVELTQDSQVKKLLLLSSAAFLAATLFSTVHAQEELIYVAVDPCRLADTRQSNQGVIRANTFRNILISGTFEELGVQGGGANCPNPKAASGMKPAAVAAYIIAVPANSSTSGGVLTAYPSNLPPPPQGTGSTVNFAAGQVVGNTTIVKVCSDDDCPFDGELAILARNTDEHVVVDVQGYFYSEEQPPRIEIVSAQRQVNFSGGTTEGLDVTCPEGTQIISGGAFATGDTVITDSYPVKAVSDTQETWSSRFASRRGADVSSSISSIAVCVSGFRPTIVTPPG